VGTAWFWVSGRFVQTREGKGWGFPTPS